VLEFSWQWFATLADAGLQLQEAAVSPVCVLRSGRTLAGYKQAVVGTESLIAPPHAILVLDLALADTALAIIDDCPVRQVR